MTCPSELRGARFTIPGSFPDIEFFRTNTVDCWKFEDYLLWCNASTSSAKNAYSLFLRYLAALNDLKQYNKLPRPMSTYISSLKQVNTYTKEQFYAWWNQGRDGNSKKTINNISGSHNIVNTAEIMVMSDSQQPQQQSLSRQSSPQPSYPHHPLDERGEKRKQVDADNDNLLENEKDSWDSIDRHPRRKSKTDYSVNELSTPPSGSWLVNGENVVDYLVQYQNNSKYGATKQKNLSDDRVLSLSSVFLFSLDPKLSCTHRLDVSHHVAILDSLNIKRHLPPVFDDAAIWCLKLDHQLHANPTINTKEAKRTAMGFCMDEYADDNQGIKTITAETLLSIVRRFDHWVNDCFLESTFITQHLMPFMSNVFEKETKFTGAIGESCVSKNGDVDDNGPTLLMADYMVFYESRRGQRFDLLATEVKPVGRTSAGQLQSDLVKLGKEMKRMVDSLVDAGVDNIVVGGVLVEGLSCSTYIMDLKFDGMYRMTQLANFHLLRGSSDIMLVPRIIQYLVQLRTILQHTASNIDNKHNYTSLNNNSTMSTPRSWKRKASGLPKRI